MQIEAVVKCPWCEKGEVICEGTNKGIVTIRCPKCLHFFKIELSTMQCVKAAARKRIPTKVHPYIGNAIGKNPIHSVTD